MTDPMTPQRDVPREPPEGWRSTRGCGYHHYTPENIAAIVRDLKACEQGTELPEWINRDHRTACGVLWRVISALAFDAAPAAAPADPQPVAWQLVTSRGTQEAWIRLTPPIDDTEEYRPLYAHPPATAPAANRDRPTTEPGGCECEKCGCIFVGAEHHTLCAVCAAAPAAPALDMHTLKVLASAMQKFAPHLALELTRLWDVTNLQNETALAALLEAAGKVEAVAPTPAAAPAAPFVPPMAQCWDCGGWYATTVGHKCAATTIAAAPAAPAPDADASAGLVEALRICWNKHCATHMNSQRARAADLIEQQARELAAMTAERDHEREIRKHDRVDRERAETALSAARAAIAAADADAARYRFLRMSPTQLGWDADYRPDEVDAAIDAARAAMGEK